MAIRHTVFLLLVGGVIVAGFAFLKAWEYGLVHPVEVPPRPATVPQDAVAIPNIAKTSMYARCWLSDTQPFCEVFAPDGAVVWNERFRPDRPGAVISPEQLQIDTIRTQARDFIALTNGTYLLPSTNYEDHQRVLEEQQALLKRYQR